MNLRSGYPFWLIKSGLPFDYKKLEKNIKADVVIMGGGISGALAAYYLTAAGINCVVVDARTIGLGSSCASTSLLQYEIDTPLSELKNKIGEVNAIRAYCLCADAIAKLGEIANTISYTDFSYKKSLYYAANKKDIVFLEKEFAIRKKSGFAVNYLEEAEVKKQFNFFAPGAILSAVGAQTNAYTFTHALHQYSIKNGLSIYDRTAILNIAHQKNKVILKTENGYTIKTKKLVYATGYEVVNFIEKKIVELHSTYATISEQVNHINAAWKNDVLIWNTADPYLYMRTTQDGRILIGGRDEKFYNPIKRDKLIVNKTKQLATDFNKIFPDKPFKPEFSWAGTFGVTKDGLPVIGNYKKLPNSFFALGFGGNGITFSQIAAEILVNTIKNKKNKADAIFSFDRW